MTDNKSSYTAEEIQVLEGLEPVRKRPGMYIGSTDSRGLHECLREIVDNSVDESFAGVATDVWIHLTKDGGALIRDNGRGIPVDVHKQSGVSALELTMTKLHAGGKFGGSGYKISSGLHGVGASVVNALSSYFRVIVLRDNKAFFQEYSEGKTKDKVKEVSQAQLDQWLPKEWGVQIGKNQTGTITKFIIDEKIFHENKFDKTKVVNFLRDRAYLIAGFAFHFYDERDDDARNFYFEGGIKSLVAHGNRGKKPISDVIYVNKSQDPNSCEVAIQYTDTYNENVKGYVNGIHTTDGGTHVTGFRIALTRSILDYGKRSGIIKDDKKTEVTGEDLKEGLNAVVYVKVPSESLQFESQTKAKLNNPEIQGFVASSVKEGLDTYFEENPQNSRRILEKVMLAAKARLAARAAKDAILRKGALEGMSLPGKLSDCQSTDPAECEIFLVEGQSAGGTAKGGRNSKYQAILPLKGKVLNTERAHLEHIIKFEELKNLIVALGAGIGESINYEKLRYHRIIIMTDADVDGDHIKTLVLTFFFRHLPDIINKGHLYIAVPPLFRIQSGKKIDYAYSDTQRDQLLSKLNGAKFSIQRYKGLGEMNADQIRETTMDPATRMLKLITIDKAEEADKMFTMLMGEDVAPRKNFIQTHATTANLDI